MPVQASSGSRVEKSPLRHALIELLAEIPEDNLVYFRDDFISGDLYKPLVIPMIIVEQLFKNDDRARPEAAWHEFPRNIIMLAVRRKRIAEVILTQAV